MSFAPSLAGSPSVVPPRRRAARTRALVCALAVATASLVLASSALATIVVPLTRQAQVERSEWIVRGTVSARRSTWNQDHSQIVSFTTIRVDEWLKGQGPQSITLRQYGGTVDGIASEISGDPQLRPGSEVVLFLKKGEGVCYLLALGQSAYVVVGRGPNATVHRDLEGLTFAVRNASGMQLADPPADPPETLTALLASIRSMLRSGR